MSRSTWKAGILGLMAFSMAALAVVGWVGVQRRDAYRTLAAHHLAEMATFEANRKSAAELAEMYEGKAPKSPLLAFMNPAEPGHFRDSETLNAKRAAYHSALSLKYQQAAERPWITVEADPMQP